MPVKLGGYRWRWRQVKGGAACLHRLHSFQFQFQDFITVGLINTKDV